MKLLTYYLFPLCLILAATVKADEINEKLQVHGFAAQGVVNVEHSNFVDADHDFSFRLTEVGLNASYQLSPKLRLAGQAVYLNGGNRFFEGLRLDYLLLDWTLISNQHWLVDLYFGRFKNNHWLYSNTRDIPFARPSIILPQSVYYDGFRDIAMGGDGAAIKATYTHDHWGEIDINFSYGASSIREKQKQIMLSNTAFGEVKQDFDAQASMYWRPSFSSWQFGVSLLDSDFSYQQNKAFDNVFSGEFDFQFYTLNALYEGERWEFSGEIYQERFVTKNFYSPNMQRTQIGQGIYLQSRYQINDDWKWLLRAEKFYVDKNDKNGHKLEINSGGLIPKYFAYHYDLTTNISYDLGQHMRIQLEQHWFRGGGRLSPVVMPNPVINDREYWQLTALQLMMWF